MAALYLILVLAYFQLQSVHGAETVQGLGVNWGTQAYHSMDPKLVVAMLKENGIKKAKLFDSDPFVISAFSGTDIEVMVAIPNGELSRFATSSKVAEDYVKENITIHIQNGGVNIRYIAVGNEPFLNGYNGSYVNTTFPAMQNIQKAINKAGYAEKIKVTTPINGDVYTSAPSYKPSDGEFRSDIHDLMIQICKFLEENNSPFVVNIYPFFNVYQIQGFPLEFAFFDGQIAPTIDKNATYTNVYDANVDTLATALKRNGFSNVRIVVGEIGWPTDGDRFATLANAKRFYSGLLKEMGSKKGTPMRPGPMDVYMFSLFDENLKSIDPGNFERHWGVFYHDGKPKFPVDFSGQGQDKWPVGAKNVRYQDRKWCVLKEDVNDSDLIQKELDYACKNADCTSLGQDSSCGKLTLAGNASYAFNNYFQTRNQIAGSCGFNNLATIVTEDPSNGTCLFPIELMETIPTDGIYGQKDDESSAQILTSKTLLISFTLFLLSYVTLA